MLGALGVLRTPFQAEESPARTTAESAQFALSPQDLKGCLAIQGRDLDDAQTQSVRQALQRNLQQFQAVRDLDIADAVSPALIFRPRRR